MASISFVMFCLQACLFQIAFTQFAGYGSSLGIGPGPGQIGSLSGPLGSAGPLSSIGPVGGPISPLGSIGALGPLGNSIGPNPLGLNNAISGLTPQMGVPGPGAYYGNPAGYPGYGGSGSGDVAVVGELPVAGSTVVSGQVPIVGGVQFGGTIPAVGFVTVTGTCACGAPY